MGNVRTDARAGLAALLLAASAGLGACRDTRRPTLPPPRPEAVTPPAAPAADPAERFLTTSTTLRRTPSDPPKPKGDGKAQPGGALAFLHRGERVTFLEAQGDWARVRASDGLEGWLRSSVLLPTAGVAEGTVLTTAWAFDRPDLLAVNARRKVDPGTLLLVLKSRELFSEVDLGQGGSAWVLTEGITSRAEDVGAAKLLEKARWLARAGRADEAKEVLALLRSSQPSSPLVPVLALELGEAPPAPPGGPSGSTGPTGPTGPEGAALRAGGTGGPSGP
jgi:hypothetical protein